MTTHGKRSIAITIGMIIKHWKRQKERSSPAQLHSNKTATKSKTGDDYLLKEALKVGAEHSYSLTSPQKNTVSRKIVSTDLLSSPSTDEMTNVNEKAADVEIESECSSNITELNDLKMASKVKVEIDVAEDDYLQVTADIKPQAQKVKQEMTNQHELAISSDETAEKQTGALPEAITIHQLCQYAKRSRSGNSYEAGTSETTSWSYVQTALLIETFKENAADFRNPMLMKRDAWKHIAREMREKGCLYNAEQCDKKWRSLTYRYKKIAQSHGPNSIRRKRWEFFDMLDDILAEDPVVQPAITISSIDSVKYNEGFPTLSSASLSCPEPPTLSLSEETDQKPCERSAKCKARKRWTQETGPPQWLSQFMKIQQEHMKELRERSAALQQIETERNHLLQERNHILRSIADGLLNKN